MKIIKVILFAILIVLQSTSITNAQRSGKGGKTFGGSTKIKTGSSSKKSTFEKSTPLPKVTTVRPAPKPSASTTTASRMASTIKSEVKLNENVKPSPAIKPSVSKATSPPKALDPKESGNLSLFKYKRPQTGDPKAYKFGDFFLNLPNQYSDKLNWRQNKLALKREMSLNKPIYDSYKLGNGSLIPTKGFLNLERSLLKAKGWIYNKDMDAWINPIK
ncbi:hypothetical protein [Pedobacter aquatilis]|uniref:hypothetical protein n=1 Tax=Pedobacter aquatilis TaxID=351343 RepID=UPI0029309107|nr:hypothetical protein [Pedobacter aquatilis]